MPEKSEWEIFFDHHAPQYMQNSFTANTAAEVEFLIEELNLPKGSLILDIGCGTGRHAVGLASRGYHVPGVDLSNRMLEEARRAAEKAGVKLELIHADATKFKSERLYDAAICICEGAFALLGAHDDPLEHDLAILKNINAALKPRAPLILGTLNAAEKIAKFTEDDIRAGKFNLLTLVETFTMECGGSEGQKSVTLHEKGYTAPELRLLLQLAGFEALNFYGGTAGDWGHRPLRRDDIEIMVVAGRLDNLQNY